jgi:hypothetical protein
MVRSCNLRGSVAGELLRRRIEMKGLEWNIDL